MFRNMYYIHTYIYIYKHVYIYTHTYIYIYIYTVHVWEMSKILLHGGQLRISYLRFFCQGHRWIWQWQCCNHCRWAKRCLAVSRRSSWETASGEIGHGRDPGSLETFGSQKYGYGSKLSTPINGWCYPTKHDHFYLWVMDGTLMAWAIAICWFKIHYKWRFWWENHS